jgi:hypothetical protein
MKTTTSHLILSLLRIGLTAGLASFALGEASVRVEPIENVGPRPLEKQTAEKLVHDYLEAWQSLGAAFEQNRPAVLDTSFVGVAREKLEATIRQQQAAGIQTRYVDRSHDLRFAFYSSEGLSIQLLDVVQYDVEFLDHARVVGARHLRSRYVVVFTPTEVRWKVRFFQAGPEE